MKINDSGDTYETSRKTLNVLEQILEEHQNKQDIFGKHLISIKKGSGKTSEQQTYSKEHKISSRNTSER